MRALFCEGRLTKTQIVCFTRQAVAVMISEKKNKSTPVRIAPTILVATNGIANKTTENSTVPTIPLSKEFTVFAVQDAAVASVSNAFTSRIAKYATATPNVTHKNAGVTVMTAMMRKKAATTPIIRLTTTAMLVHVFLQPQPKFAISKSPPIPPYSAAWGGVKERLNLVKKYAILLLYFGVEE